MGKRPHCGAHAGLRQACPEPVEGLRRGRATLASTSSARTVVGGDPSPPFALSPSKGLRHAGLSKAKKAKPTLSLSKGPHHPGIEDPQAHDPAHRRPTFSTQPSTR